MTLKRNDKQYLDVESFEEYEFTKCIAYEMAIRNDRVIEILTKGLINSHNIFKGNHQLEKELKDETKELLNEYGISEDFHFEYHFFNEANKIFEEGLSIFCNGDQGLTPEEILYRQYLQERPNYDNEKSSPKMVDFKNKNGSKYDRFKEYKGFCRYTVIETGLNSPQYKTHSITPKFKRPSLNLDLIDNGVSIYIDLSIPENELIAYIKHLKKVYNRDMINSPYDDFVHKISKTDKNKKSLPKGSTMADIFYIYDCIKLGYKKSKIQREVFKYYADQGIETRTLDYKTMKKYQDIAIDYIDNKRYLELVTGKKLEELEELKNRNFEN